MEMHDDAKILTGLPERIVFDVMIGRVLAPERG